MDSFPFFIEHDNPRTRRNNDELLLPIVNVKYKSYELFYHNRITRLWNNLPYDIRNIQLTPSGYNTTFKIELKRWLYQRFLDNFDTSTLCTWTSICNCTKCKF
jgi:hypothetical protein